MGIESDNSTLKVFCFNLEFIKFVGVETIAFYFVTSRFDFLQDCYNFVLFLVLLYSLLIDETLQLRSIISNENNIFKYLIVCFWKQWYSFFTSKYSCFIRQSYNIYTCNLDGSKKKKKNPRKCHGDASFLKTKSTLWTFISNRFCARLKR